MPDVAEDTVATKAQAELNAAQSAARKQAAEHLMLFWPREDTPRRGLDGVLRHGYGRAIELVPQSETVARMALERDIEDVSKALERRVFALQTLQPGCTAKIGYLYAVADIIGVSLVRDWDELWQAAQVGDWNEVCLLLVALQWTAIDRSAVDRRKAAGNLIFGLRAA